MISDELVEKARKAFVGKWNGVVPFDTASLDADMRAAILAIVPDILEEAAELAEAESGRGFFMIDYPAKLTAQYQAEAIAAAIRAMAAKVTP